MPALRTGLPALNIVWPAFIPGKRLSSRTHSGNEDGITSNTGYNGKSVASLVCVIGERLHFMALHDIFSEIPAGWMSVYRISGYRFRES